MIFVLISSLQFIGVWIAVGMLRAAVKLSPSRWATLCSGPLPGAVQEALHHDVQIPAARFIIFLVEVAVPRKEG